MALGGGQGLEDGEHGGKTPLLSGEGKGGAPGLDLFTPKIESHLTGAATGVTVSRLISPTLLASCISCEHRSSRGLIWCFMCPMPCIPHYIQLAAHHLSYYVPTKEVSSTASIYLTIFHLNHVMLSIPLTRPTHALIVGVDDHLIIRGARPSSATCPSW